MGDRGRENDRTLRGAVPTAAGDGEERGGS